MNSLPKKLIRLDDGMEFVLDKFDNLYYIKLSVYAPDTFGYTYERLMDDPRSKGKFKVSDGTEDIKQMKKDWMNRMMASNTSGCGDDAGC